MARFKEHYHNFDILRLAPRQIFSKNSRARSEANISEEAHLLNVSPITIYWRANYYLQARIVYALAVHGVERPLLGEIIV